MIEKIVLGSYLKRLDNIIQWQERDVFTKESVSQHSFKVSVFVRIIVEELFKDFPKDYAIEGFKLNCVTNALFHDWDEAIFLRDIAHTIKYNSHNGEDIRKAIDDYVNFEFEKEFGNDENIACINMLRQSIIDVDPMVKKVVKVGDWLGLLFFCRRELALGNANFKETYKYCKSSLRKSAFDMCETISKYYNVETSNVFESFQKIILYEDIYGPTSF